MANDIGVRVGLEGEQQFKTALQDINSNLKTLGTEMKAVTSAYDKNDKSAGALTAQNQVLNKQIEEQKSKLDLLKTKLSETADKYGENDEKTKKMQQAVNLATADLNKMERQLGDNNSALKNGTQSQNKMAESSEKLKSAQDKLKTGLKAVAVAAAAMAASLAAGFVKAGQAADDINTLAKQTGLTTAEIQKFQYATDLIDVPLETLTGSMAKLTRNMSTAQKGSGDAAKAFTNLGISVTDGSGQLRNNQDVFNEAITALGKIENQTQRDAYAMAIFGKSAQDLNPLILGGADALKKLGDEAEAAGLILSQDALDNLNAMNDTLDTFKAQMKAGGMAVLSEFAEPISAALAKIDMTKVVEGVKEFINGIIENKDKILAAVSAIATGLIAWNVASMVIGLVTAIKTFREALIAAKVAQQGLNFAMKANVIGIVVTVVAALVAGLIVLWNTNEDFRNAFINAWNAIKTKVGEVVGSIKTLFSGLVGWFKTLPENMLSIGKNIVEGIWTGISNAKDWLVTKIKEWCGSILKGIKAFFGIQSPSRLMRDEVGIMIARGVGVGIEDGIVFAQRATKKLGSAITSEISNLNAELARMEKAEIAEQAAKELAEHKKAIKAKYDELGKAEKKDKQKILDEIASLQADWNEKQIKAEKDAAKLSLQEKIKALEDFKQEYDAALSEIENKQQSMAKKLSDYGSLLQTATTGSGREYLKLGDLQKDIDKITAYGDALAKLKERGISDSLMGEITSMNIDDAISYTDLLLKKTPGEYDKYMKLWEEKQKLAGEVAKKFYQDEFDQLQTEFVDKIPSELSSLKTEMEGIGKNSAEGLADGFWSKKAYIVSTFKSVLQEALSEAKASMEIRSPSRKWAEVGSYMAQGLGVGFTDQMRSVASQINASIPTGSDIPSQTARAVGDTVNGLAPLFAAGQNAPQTIIVRSILDGRIVAESVIDPLKSVARQRGVSLA